MTVELKHLCETFGLENCGFLTLTLGGKQDPCLADMQARFNSLRTHVLSVRYPRGIWVVERGDRNQRLHMHGVVVVGKDIWTAASGRGPLDFNAVAGRDYRSANDNLRSEWAFWRNTAHSYGFGRTELLPIKTTVDGIARYVGSYIKKQVEHRIEGDKGARFVRFVNYSEKRWVSRPLMSPLCGPGILKEERSSLRKASSRFAWNNERAFLWRQKVGAWAAMFHLHDMDEIRDTCGPRWAYLFQEQILGMKLAESVFANDQDEVRAMHSLDLELRQGLRIRKAKHLKEGKAAGRVVRTVVLEERNYEAKGEGSPNSLEGRKT